MGFYGNRAATRDAGGGWGKKKRNKTDKIDNVEPGDLVKILGFPSYLLGSQ